MGARSRRSNPKRRRALAASVGDGDGDSGGGGGVDLINSLNDDLLLCILDLVPDAGNVVRTHALSRRWRGLWTGVTALRFDFDSTRESCGSHTAAQRYIAFVNGSLALRATPAEEPASVEHLAISFDISRHETVQLTPLSVEATQGWIRYALQHAVKSFTLKLSLPWRVYDAVGDDNDIEQPMITLHVMDNYANMETMHLGLGVAQLRLPSSTVVFPSLIDLTLGGITVPAGGDTLLSRLVSSVCCPRLQKLGLRHLIFDASLMGVMLWLCIEANTLLELSLESMHMLQFLELRTPSLQVRHIVNSDLSRFTVSAPRLESLRFWGQLSLHIDDVHGHLSTVRTLKIQMVSHGEIGFVNEETNNANIHLLQCCRSTRCLEVSSKIPMTKDQTIDIIKGRIPPLPYVTRLAVHIKLREQHSTGPGIECLLAQCRNIKYLRLQLRYIVTWRNLSVCDNNSCHWRSHEFSLDHLEEVEFKELVGNDCEFQFIQSILTKATGIQKVTISFNQHSWSYWRKDREHALELMPPLDGGLWTMQRYRTCGDVYEWRRVE